MPRRRASAGAIATNALHSALFPWIPNPRNSSASNRPRPFSSRPRSFSVPISFKALVPAPTESAILRGVSRSASISLSRRVANWPSSVGACRSRIALRRSMACAEPQDGREDTSQAGRSRAPHMAGTCLIAVWAGRQLKKYVPST